MTSPYKRKKIYFSIFIIVFGLLVSWIFSYVTCQVFVISGEEYYHGYITATKIADKNSELASNIIDEAWARNYEKGYIDKSAVDNLRLSQIHFPKKVLFKQPGVASTRLYPGTWLLMECGKNGAKARLVKVTLNDELLLVDLRRR